MDKQTKRFYEFGPFRLDLTQRILLRDGQHIPLTLKAYETLHVLVENNGRIMEKEELLNQIWPDTFIEEATLAKNVSTLRKVLAERDGTQEYIETIPKRGYRFVAEVKDSESGADTIILQEHTRLHVVAEEIESNAEPTAFVSAPTAVATDNQKRRGFWLRVVVAAVLLIGLTTAAFYWHSVNQDKEQAKTKVRSLAVLPFKFVGASEEDAYLGVGLTDALITKLVNLRQVVVRPTSSVLKYQTEGRDVVVAGRELQVEAVLDGRVQKYGQQIRISLQLVRVADGAVLWGGEFAGQEADILTLQDTMGERVARGLVEHLTSEEQQLLVKRCTENAEACSFYLRGRHFWNKGLAEKGAEYFQKAIERDPNYALAYAGLAQAYDVISQSSSSRMAFLQRAKDTAVKAIELDETLPDAHIALAFIKSHLGQDWIGAEREYRRALELNPNFALGHGWYGVHLFSVGRLEEALHETTRAQELDPVSCRIAVYVAWCHYFAHNYDRAIEQAKKAIDLDATFDTSSSLLGKAYERKGLYEQAVDTYLKVRTKNREQLKEAFAKAGMVGYYQKLLALDSESGHPSNWYDRVSYHLLRGEKEQALEALQEDARRANSILMITIKVEPLLDPLRTDQRFTALLRSYNLSP